MTLKKHSLNNKNTTKKRLPRNNKLNCNPNIKSVVIRGSCLPNDLLNMLKKSYNDNNPDNIITSEKPRKIWKDLKMRLKTCVKEDCWLDIISDDEYREKIEKYLFIPRPLQPNEWKSNPNAWLSNFDIDHVLQEYENSYPHFKDVYVYIEKYEQTREHIMLSGTDYVHHNDKVFVSFSPTGEKQKSMNAPSLRKLHLFTPLSRK